MRLAISALIDPPVLYPDVVLEEQLALIEAAWRGQSERAAFPGFGLETLDRFGILHLARRFPHELSSGQHQLALLSVTFARPCDVLLLDEPEQRLDPSRRALLAEACIDASEWWEDGPSAAVVFASHSPELVEAVSERSVRLDA